MALSANTVDQREIDLSGYRDLSVAASQSFFFGSLVVFDLTGAKKVTGTLQGHLRCVGVARGSMLPGSNVVTASETNNASGAAGDLLCRVKYGAIALKNDATKPVLASHMGHPVYAKDDETVSADNDKGNRPVAGIFLGFEPSSSRPIVDVGSSFEAHSGTVVALFANASVTANRIVELVNDSGAAEVAHATADTDIVKGVSLNGGSAGDLIYVATSGFAPVVLGGTGATAADLIEATAGGTGQTAGTTDYFVGVAMATGAAADTIMVLVEPGILAA